MRVHAFMLGWHLATTETTVDLLLLFMIIGGCMAGLAVVGLVLFDLVKSYWSAE